VAAVEQTRGGFGRLLLELRLRAGLSQEALANAAGLSVRAVSDLERGRARGPQRRTVQALADALRLDPGQAEALDEAAQAGRPRTRAVGGLGVGGGFGGAGGPDGVGGPGASGAAGGQGLFGSAAAIGFATAERRRVPLMHVPSDLADFTGRDEPVGVLLRALRTPARAVSIAAVSGMAGIGKTALAVHVAHAVRGDFPDGLLFVDLQGGGRSAADAGSVLIGFLIALGVSRAAIPAVHSPTVSLYGDTPAGAVRGLPIYK
jgi:DNA-binding XRE family transcriptional regulator